MNFLLHRRLAELELGSAAAGVGAMLPDLWRMADRRVRPSKVEAPREDAPPAGSSVVDVVVDVLAGIEHHVAIDRWFHTTPEFTQGERACAELLRAAAPPSLRLGLFAHSVWEMALDGALVAHEGVEAMRAGLDRGFTSVEGAIERAVHAHHFSRIDRHADDRKTFEVRMKRITDELRTGGASGWIASYQTGEGLAACVQGVRARVGLPRVEPGVFVRLAGALDDVAIEATRALWPLLERRAASLASEPSRPSALASLASRASAT